MKRREFIKDTGLVMAATPFMNFASTGTGYKKMIVLGIDGLDPRITYQLMKQGQLPNMKRLAQRGTFTMMRTTIPPHSPVAWSSFITGSDPGTFGIFDWVHRDPKTYFPFPSWAETFPSEWIVKLGKYRIPLKSGKVVLKREGKAFWDYLENRDIDATIFKVPCNYPPSESKQRTISGMGTPDILGTYGIYTLFSSDEEESEKDISPNNLYYAYINDDNVMENGIIEGPKNDLVEDGEKVEIPFRVYLDNQHKTARIDIQGKEILIGEKEYSDWVEIEFPLIKNVSSVTGMVKFYLMEMGETFRLYVTPVQISPRNPALTISTPSSYSKELVQNCGLFHTINLPADTKALSQGTFSMENFIVQSSSIFNESKKIFRYEFDRFLQKKSGFLFFYFSAVDQGQHMFWALNDKDHPYYKPDQHKKYGYIHHELYRMHDKIVGEVLKRCPRDVSIMVISDHGFNPFRRNVNINNWLYNEGYQKLVVDDISEEVDLLGYADWNNTRAYFMGLNGLYLNQKGREGQGIVTRAERRKLLEELKAKLEMISDPKSGEKVIAQAYITEDHFSKDFLDRAPDIIVGFNRGYRCGDGAALGGFSEEMLSDRMDWWSGDHLVDPSLVPASFISSFKINNKLPHIKDLAPTILKYFGIEKVPTVKGKSLI
ncbi:MAG: alkaline phosphatase family protein [Candidatus Aminicenantes bacterium]|nr:alkaline phosphatase family protein [Candidatus Aminicenantes bacterium]